MNVMKLSVFADDMVETKPGAKALLPYSTLTLVDSLSLSSLPSLPSSY